MSNSHAPRRMAPTLAVSLLAFAGSSLAQDPDHTQSVFSAMSWRSLGPTNFSGRVVDIAVHPENARTFYVATASGGLFKTDSGGTRFEALFQDQPAFSIGDVALAPSRPEVVYVGTGEANNQRSSYWGDGVYRSNDGGKTWQHVGLRGTDHIGRIVVHPTNPDTVWVAALGALYKPNEERGLYMTTDGGQTWEKTLSISPDVGVVDVAIHPQNPDVLWCASYERRRRAWDFSEDGAGSAIWRSSDSGKTWKKVTKGLPSGQIGRIGLDAFAGDGDIVYACVENNNPRGATAPRTRPEGNDTHDETIDDPKGLYPIYRADALEDVDPAPGAVARPIGGQVYRSEDGGKSWSLASGERSVGGSPGYYYGQIRVDPSDADRVYVLGVTIAFTEDGGETWRPRRGRRGGRGDGAAAGRMSFGRSLHVDHHALWIDPKDGDHCLLGNDGGLGQSWDGGRTWDHLAHIPAAQFYAVAVDNRDPYWIYGGTQDNGTWALPSRTGHSGGILPENVHKIGGGDGFQVAIDPDDPDVVYYESQFGALRRSNLATGEGAGIRPQSRKGQPSLRFNWMSPILMSPHDPRTIYFGSQYVHRSDDRGDSWEVISPDLSANDRDRLAGDVPHCTVTCIDESPLRRDRIWAGTDDGRVWMTSTGGKRWTELSDRFPDLPPRLWVSRIELSPHDEDTAFVAFTGYREDDRAPYLYLTTDGGETFLSIANDLPLASVNVVCHHPANEDMVLVGTEMGAFVSIDWGAHWFELGDLGASPVHDLVVHPRELDVVLATHGRGMFVLEGELLESLSADSMRQPIQVLPPTDGYSVRRAPNRGYFGRRTWTAANPPTAPTFGYILADAAEQPVTLKVLDATGEERWSWTSDEDSSGPGLHRIRFGQSNQQGGNQRGGRLANFSRGRGRRASLAPGDYVLVAKQGDTEISRQAFSQR